MTPVVAAGGNVALRAFDDGVIVYFVILAFSYLSITVGSAMVVRRYFRRFSAVAVARSLRSTHTPPVSICTSAYNEAEAIVDSVRAMLALQYPRHEVVLCNDGSTDDTLTKLIDAFELSPVDQPLREDLPTAHVRAVYRSRLYRNLVVLDKENGGRSDGLNAAINAAGSPLICCIDADSILEYDALLDAVQPFIEDPEHVVGAGGLIRVANGCRIDHGHVVETHLPHSPLAMLQVVEYLRAFLAARSGWSAINGLVIISGAFGVFRRSAVVAAGGFATDTVGEDFELCVRLHRCSYEQGRRDRLAFVPDPVCWTEVPERLRQLGGQRNRWHRGLVDTLWRHRRMIGNPRYGVVGMMSLPFFVLFEFFGAFIEIAGWAVLAVSLVLGAINWPFALVFMAVALLSGVVLSLSAVLLEDVAFRRHGGLLDLARLIAYAIGENFGYRQIITYYRVRGFFAFLRGDRAWGVIERRGFAAPSTDAAGSD